MILSILAALVGSTAGAGVRAGISVLEQRIGAVEREPGPIMVNGSLTGAIAAGVVADTIGRGPGLAFWLGAVLGAAGADRVDWWAMRKVGLDPEALMARARAAAMQQASRVRNRTDGAGEAAEA